MDKISLCNKLEQTTYRVRAFENGELFSEGSAFCFSERGILMTAAHVIDGGKPFDVHKFDETNIKIEASTKNGPVLNYRPNICGIKINWPDGPFKEYILIDLAVLNPVKTISDAPYLEISNQIQQTGTEILMSGFPDELEFPLNLDKNLDIKYLKETQDGDEVSKNLSRFKGMLIMHKSGMIGFSDNIIIDPKLGDGFKLSVGIYYIDNGMHSGASGGPVINKKGKVIGVITKRAVTKVSYPDLDNPSKEVPSGSTLAITPKTIINFSKYQISKNNFKL